MLSLIPFQLQGPILATVAAILYFVTYRFNELFDVWFLYDQGINLVFLPAGIKHLAILLGGPWGALGCFVSLFILANEFWQGVPTGDIALYSLVSTCATWAGSKGSWPGFREAAAALPLLTRSTRASPAPR